MEEVRNEIYDENGLVRVEYIVIDTRTNEEIIESLRNEA
jgi:hypothetical protein